ncbi:MAG: hypothetical protein MUC96_05625 [Myxococcaceae bacterium]|jgi:hypothetical protein|nr:hypothetical protein [Myxococcaceae bacterium]
MSFLKKLFKRPEQFRDAVVAHLRSRGDDRAVAWVDDDERLFLEVLDSYPGDGQRLDLTEAFESWNQSGDLAPATAPIDALVRPGAVTTPSFYLMPRFHFVAGDGRPKLASGLTLDVLRADEKGVEVLTPEGVQEQGITLAQVVAQLSPSLFEFEQPSPDVQLYVTSHPGAVLARVSELALPLLPGEPVFILLNSTQMLITGSTDWRGLHAAAAIIREALADKPLGLCYVLRGGALVPWLPPRSEPTLRVIFIAMRRAGLETAYAAQRENAGSQTKIFVANYTVEGAAGLPLVSLASWAKDVVTALPLADVLVLGRTLTDFRSVSRDLAFERFADLLEPIPNLWPPRFVTKVPH